MGHNRIPFPSAAPVYAAAESWRDRSLIGELGLFSDERIATLENVELLHERVVEQPDFGKGKFEKKLQDQLAGAPSSAIQLAAELLFVHLLIARSTLIGGQRKAALVRSVLDPTDSNVVIPEACAEALESGLINPGQGFNSHRPAQFRYMIQFLLAVKRMPPEQRERAVHEADRLVELTASIDNTTAAIQRFALEHLLFPAQFSPVVSRDHRQQMLKRWNDAGGTTNQSSFALAAVAASLTENVRWGGVGFVNFYRAPHSWEWRAIDKNWEAFAFWCVLVRSHAVRRGHGDGRTRLQGLRRTRPDARP
jgi:5-methylcytosine-specific restriction enzyme B